MIEISNVHKRYGSTSVLCGVSIEVKKGEVSVLLGPSGGGKSTLLRTINALETFDEGRIRIDDLELTANGRQEAHIRQIRRRVGMVFQQFNLFRQTRVLISGANAWGSEPFSLAIIFLGAPPDGGCDSRAGGLSLGTSDGLSRVGYSLAA